METMSASRKSSAERGAVTSAMTCTSSADLNLRAFSFENQSSYDANRELTRLRDINFRLRPPSKDDDIWKRPPPDFRPQCFEPRPPKRNSREAMKPWRYTDEKDDNTSPPNSATSQTPMSLPELMKPKSAEEKDFTLKFHIMDSAESKADFVTTGMFPAGPFKNPKIHDHRPVSYCNGWTGQPSISFEKLVQAIPPHPRPLRCTENDFATYMGVLLLWFAFLEKIYMWF